MSSPAITNPRVTIVMIARERHALTESALESLVENTTIPYRLIYTDGQSPDWLWERLAARADEWRLTLVRHEERIWPQKLRNMVMDLVDTEYVVFIDNDVEVAPGWLEKLLDCADQTGAGIVGPLYLWGDGITPPLIHMAGGTLTRLSTEEGVVLTEFHDLINQRLQDIELLLGRHPCDFVEFHCMLLRTELVKHNKVLDENILNVHEHIDTALSVKQQGFPVYLEPASRVNYLAYAPYVLDDLLTHRWRWAEAPTETSIHNFCKKWNALDDPRAFDGVRTLARQLAANEDPIRPSALNKPELQLPMQKHELAQTRSSLLDQAAAQGYSTNELHQLSGAYNIAQRVSDGSYRPCGRPFINHLVGATSILIRYGFKIDIVLAGMLHSAYEQESQRPQGSLIDAAMLTTYLGGKDSPVESRVSAYSLRREMFSRIAVQPTLSINIRDMEIMLISVANELEMHLSGEVQYSGRARLFPPNLLNHATTACNIIGIKGLADSLLYLPQPPSIAPELLTNIPASYRMEADKRSLIPVGN